MTYQEAREVLEKQLELLSERAQSEKDGRTLVAISNAMCEIIQALSAP